MVVRYLGADLVELPASAPQFVELGHCRWCNKPLTGKSTKYCQPTEEDRQKYEFLYYNIRPPSACRLAFANWWYSRPAFIRAIFILDYFTCQQCGYHQVMENRPWLPDLSNLECDHILPVARGGLTELDNLQTLCRECNRRKGAAVPGDPGRESPRVIPSRDNSKCPNCGSHGYRVLPWQPPEYYDDRMVQVECSSCKAISYLGPTPLNKWKLPPLNRQEVV